MHQVQKLKLPSKNILPSNAKYLLRGALPSNLRSSHDLVCFLIIFILALAFVFAFNLAIIQGKPAQFLYPTGQGFICGYDEAKQFPYAYFYNPLVNNKTVCVKQCPKLILIGEQKRVQPIQCYYNFKCNYQAQLTQTTDKHLNDLKVLGYPTMPTVGKVCIPESTVLTKSLQPSSQSLYTKLSEQHSIISIIDIYNNYILLVICTVSALLLSSIAHFLIRNVSLSKIMLPSLVLASGILFAEFFVLLCQSASIKGHFMQDTGYLGLAFLKIQYRYLGLSLAFLGFTIIFVIVAAKQIYAVKSSQRKQWDYEKTHPFAFSWKQLVIYITFVSLLLVHWALCIFTFLYLSTAQRNSGDYTKMFIQPIGGLTIQKILCSYVIFWAVFGTYIIIGFCKTISALFYSQNCASKPERRENRLFDYWVITLYHHFGSITMASFFVSLGAPIQFLLWGLKTDINRVTFINKLTCFMRWCCSGSYIQIAIKGRNYLTSSRLAYQLTWDNHSVSSIEYKNRIQSERVALTSLKVISSFICPLIIQAAFTFNLQLHTKVFQILWILVPSWIIGYSISQIILNGIQSKTQIQLTNYEISMEPRQKKQETSSMNRIFPQECIKERNQ